MYLAHLHFEVRKNLYIGMHRSKFARGYGNYWDPTYFIKTHRRCNAGTGKYQVPINTFQPYPAGSRDVVAKRPPAGASIAKVETKKRVAIPIERTKRTATRTASPSTSSRPSNTTRYMDSGTQRRTLSPTTQRIVAEEKKRTVAAKPVAPTERKTIWSRFKSKVRSGDSSASPEKKSIGRRRGLFRRR